MPTNKELEQRLNKVEETVAYLEEEIRNRPELNEDVVYDVVEAVIIALRAVNLTSTHKLADEFQERYFGPDEGE